MAEVRRDYRFPAILRPRRGLGILFPYGAVSSGSVACQCFEAPNALLIEPDVFHAPAIDHAVDHRR
jgi:hypothetical protein